MDIKKMKIMTTEEIQNFDMDNEHMEIVKDFAYLGSVINSSGDCSEEIKRRLRLRKAAKEELEEVTRAKMYHQREMLGSSSLSHSNYYTWM